MSYRVLYTQQFHDALDAQLSYFAEQEAPEARIATWLTDLLDLLDSLERFPYRHSVAELESVIKSVELRKVTFGDYLVIDLRRR